MIFNTSGAVTFTLPAIVKACQTPNGRRLVEVEASNEHVDQESDVILRSALLSSTDEFVRSGHYDLNHFSELGERLGVRDPARYIVGVPLEVRPGPGSSTITAGALHQGWEAADRLWQDLMSGDRN